MDLIRMQLEDNRKNLKATVLRREGGTWTADEVNRLVNGLVNETSERRDHPEHVIINGHHDEAKIRRLVPSGAAYTVTNVTGVDKLPWSCFVA